MSNTHRSAIRDFIPGHPTDPATRADGAGHTRVSSTGAGEGSPEVSGSGLKSSRKLWSATARDVSSLSGKLQRSLAEMSTKQQGLGTGSLPSTGFSSGAAQRATYESWKRYLRLVSRECGELAQKLENAGNGHFSNEQDTKRAFSTQQTEPENTGN